jgi:hypothetical protein
MPGTRIAVRNILQLTLSTSRVRQGMQVRTCCATRMLPICPSLKTDAMLLVDGKGCFACVSAQAKKMFGYRREELVGEPVEKSTSERCRGEHVKRRTKYNVTNLKRAHEQLHQGAEELRKLMDVGTVVPPVAHNLDCHEITANRAANAMFEREEGRSFL